MTPRRGSVLLGVVATIGLASIGRLARAQDAGGADAVALAESLFTEGKRLMNEGRFAEACPKLAESQRLDPGGGTLLNLASCHEAEGKTASAWAEFKEALAVAKRDGRADREQLAKEHVAALEAKLSRVTVSLAPGADTPELTLQIDERPLARAAWSSPFPIDPGPHTLTATAPSRRRWDAPFSIAPSEARTLVVPPLVAEAPAPPAAPPGPPGAATGAGATSTSPLRAEEADRNATRRVAGWALAATGVAGLAVGVHFGLVAMSKKSDSDAACPNGACSPQGVTLNDDAKSAARAADVFFVAGALLAAGGVVLVAVSPRTTSTSTTTATSTRALRVAPRVGLGSVGLGGAW